MDAVVINKKVESRNLKTGKVIPTDDLEAEFMFDEDRGAGKASKTKGSKLPMDAGFSRKSVKVLPTTEAGPGELLAQKNTEVGFKQRKVNKRMKSYEEVEEKDNGEGEDPTGGGRDLKKDA